MDYLVDYKKAKQKAFLRKLWINIGGWMVMLPGLVLFGLFVWYPLANNIVFSFFKSNSFATMDEFVGFNNFIALFKDPRFVVALKNTFVYLGWSLLIGFIAPIFIGLLLSEVVHAKSLFRVLIYFPAILSGMAVVIMWTYLFDPFEGSVLNTILGLFNISPSIFVQSKDLAIPLIVVTMTWRGAGSTALIYLSAIQNIDQTQYEAARLDGAGMFRRIWHITLPNIAPTLSTLFVLQCISVMQVFYEPLVMTKGGGPNNASLSLLLLGFQLRFTDGTPNPGMAAATCVVLFVIILALTLLYFFVEKLFKDGFSRGRKSYGDNK